MLRHSTRVQAFSVYVRLISNSEVYLSVPRWGSIIIPSTSDQGHRKMTCGPILVFSVTVCQGGGRQEALVYLFVVITVHEMVKIVL